MVGLLEMPFFGQQVSGTDPDRPFGLEAEQLKITVPGGCSMTRLMLVTVRTGLTPVQLGFGQPAAAPVTVSAAVSTAGLVTRVRFPFLIAEESMNVGAVTGPIRTLFCPGAVLPPLFEHW